MEGLNQMQAYPFLVNSVIEVASTFGHPFWNPENKKLGLLKHELPQNTELIIRLCKIVRQSLRHNSILVLLSIAVENINYSVL